MRGYLAVVRATFMVGLVYRFGFLFSIFGNIIYLGVAYFLWRSIYQHSETIRGLTFNETFIYIGLGSAMFILLKTYIDWALHYEIREGVIATYLIKPINLGLYMLSGGLGSLLMNLTAITVPTLLLLTLVFKVEFTRGPGLILFPLSLFMAFLISFHIDFFIGLLGFYTDSVWGFGTTKDILVTVLSGALIPLQFFPEVIRNILLWLPFQAIYHTPLMMVTKPDQSWEILLPMLYIQFTWVIILFAATQLFYNQAIKVLRIGGG